MIHVYTSYSSINYCFRLESSILHQTFQITLASKLNGNTSATYTSVVSPLYISYVTLILMSFTTKRANQCK